LQDYLDGIVSRVNLEDLSGWRLLFHVNCVCADRNGVFKKFIRYPSDKEYVVLIALAIPNSTQARYGMPTANSPNVPYYYAENERVLKNNYLFDKISFDG